MNVLMMNKLCVTRKREADPLNQLNVLVINRLRVTWANKEVSYGTKRVSRKQLVSSY